MPPSAAALERDRKRLRELRRAQTDLYYLACRLGYEWSPLEQQGVTVGLHLPLCRRLDGLRDHRRVLTISPRKSCKSTVFTICLAVQEILWDPDVTIMVNHAVEEEAENLLQEVGQHFQLNEWLRSLDPVGVYPVGHARAGEAYRVMPLAANKKFLKAGSFTVRRAGYKPTTKRQPTMRAKGAGAEITGAHCDLILLDDIIGEKTIEEATGMSRIRSWYKQTTLNVLNNNGRVRCVGTPWTHDDIYQDFRESKEWDCVVRHARETDGEMDYSGQPIHYGPTVKGGDGVREALERERMALDEMGSSVYAAQRMCDPTPSSELPWPCGYNSFVTLKEAAGPGAIFVLSDPAPWKIGGYKNLSEKKRGDGTKDYWSFAVVKLRPNGLRQEVILLDGSHSQELDIDPGCDEACRLMRKWGTNKFFTEDANTFFEPMRSAARRNGVALLQAVGGGPLKFADYNKADGKNLRFKALAGKAAQDEFLICLESCPPEFLYGDRVHTGFLTQASKWRPLPGNKNSLRFDDDADVVARATDAALQEFAPKAVPQADVFSPYREQEIGVPEYGTRYIRW